MLKWPERARTAIRKLFEPLQDIDVYIEDVNDEAFYRCLLNHSTNHEIKIARVFELGGRNAVIEAAHSHDQKKRRALFIIDGDLHWLNGQPSPEILGLHQHNAYCIENLLLCEKALTSVLCQDLAAAETDVSRSLQYTQWRDHILKPLLELFAAFVAAHVHAPTLPTVSQGVGRLCTRAGEPSRMELDPQKVEVAKQAVLNDTVAMSNQQAVQATYAATLRRLENLPDPLLAISGKDFLVPLLHFHLRPLGVRPTTKSLRFRLAGSGDPRRFEQIGLSLRQAAAGFP